jgi:hypothetical protein
MNVSSLHDKRREKMMAQYMNLLVGDYEKAKADAPNLIVVGQTIETGQQMVDKGEAVNDMILECEGDTLVLFTNNDHFLNGIRLACMKAKIDPDNVAIYEYVEGEAVPLVSYITKKGRLDRWPDCFTAIEDALCQFIR